MQVGLLSPYDEKVLAEGKHGLGIDISSLLDQINVLEIKYNYDLTKVLSELKCDCMAALGKIELKEEKKQSYKDQIGEVV